MYKNIQRKNDSFSEYSTHSHAFKPPTQFENGLHKLSFMPGISALDHAAWFMRDMNKVSLDRVDGGSIGGTVMAMLMKAITTGNNIFVTIEQNEIQKLRVVQVRIHSTFEINVGSDSFRFSPTLNLDSH